MAFVFVIGDVKVTTPITVGDYIKQILRWIEFTTEEQRNRMFNYSIDSFSDIRMFTGKDISDLSTNFSGRSQANGKINFGMRITKRTKSLLHQVQDFYCISGDSTIFDTNKVMFIQQLDTAL